VFGPRSIVFANGLDAKARRKRYVDPPFTPESIKNVHWGVLKDTIRNDLIPCLDKAAHEGTSLGLKKILTKVAIESIGRSALGWDAAPEEMETIG
jgi:hypothetical protein